MIKKIESGDWGIFTHVDVKNIDTEGTVYCDMLSIEETVQEDGTVIQTEFYREGRCSISNDNIPFAFTEEELNELNPKIEETNPIIEI